MKTSRKFIVAGTLALAILMISFTAYKVNLASNDRGGRVVNTTGTARVGGPFDLIDHNGRPVTEKFFRGKFMLVFFGYTRGPDICPAVLQVISAALERMGDDAKNIQPLFVTIDPARDTPGVMKKYLADFYAGMIGLTGSKKQIAEIAERYLVTYAKVVEPTMTGNQSGQSGPYGMDHSSRIYLMGRDGKFIRHFSYGTDPDKLAENIRSAIKG